MQNLNTTHFEEIYPHCRRALGSKTWGRVLAVLDNYMQPHDLPDALLSISTTLDLPGFISDLARVECAFEQLQKTPAPNQGPPDSLNVNPNLTLLPVTWTNLAAYILKRTSHLQPAPIDDPPHVMLWRHPKNTIIQIREATKIDLLALKIVLEQIDPGEAAKAGNVSVANIHLALDQSIAQGVLLAPESRIQRRHSPSSAALENNPTFMTADTFTLQWHITQACDLRCKHCYDRSERQSMSSDDAMAVLDDFYRFCRNMRVHGHISFTGGNPLLYPYLAEVYKAARDFGFSLAILGNPATMAQIEPLLKIAKPAYYQISLEGLPEHNDDIRGQGHFERSLLFLDQLRRLGIFSMVMLTLTRDNMDQVLPLADILNGKADAFNFNRLSAVGEGAHLIMPEKAAFEVFLRSYDLVAAENTMLGRKDNLLNIIHAENDLPLFGGCTGYGCGAAFNFVALLPDGEVHACRKFPSPIGNVYNDNLIQIYQSASAQQYRQGSHACHDCNIALVCRGCLAVTYSKGLDIFTEKDPFCFKR